MKTRYKTFITLFIFALTFSLTSAEDLKVVNKFVDDLLVTPEMVDMSNLPKGECPFGQANSNRDTHTSDVNIYTQRITKLFPIPENFVPETLVEFTHPITGETACLDATAAEHLKDLFVDAYELGYLFSVYSAYRSAEMQQELYHEYAPTMNTGIYDRVAIPGHSEHQTGTAIDIIVVENGVYYSGSRLVNSHGWKWLVENAKEYGFVMSYPKDSEHLTGYHFEPWHWRFVGVQNAHVMSLLDHSLAFDEIIIPFQFGLNPNPHRGL